MDLVGQVDLDLVVLADLVGLVDPVVLMVVLEVLEVPSPG